MALPRVLVTRRLPDAVEQHLGAHFDATFNPGDTPLDPDQLAQAMRDYDALCPTITDRLNADILGIADARVRIIANFGAGLDHVDLAAARAAGIIVTNTPDVLTDATAELAILLMLAAARRAGEGERALRAGEWSGWAPTNLIGQSIVGKTLGLVGFGRIAQKTAECARAGFGMKIAYYSRRRVPAEIEAKLDARYVPSLETLAGEADVLSLHTPGGTETRHLIDAAILALMKPSAILVNTARGTVVDEVALAEALSAGRIAAAGLDVYEREPQVHPALLEREDVVLLPHLGSATIETRVAMGMRAAANLEAYFGGKEPRDRVA
ncbi:MAG TPA: D-glycerate dehydrogenase [Sphingomonas sp.]